MQVSAAEQFILRVENRFGGNFMLNARILGTCMLTVSQIGQCSFWLDSEIVYDDFSFFLSSPSLFSFISF